MSSFIYHHSSCIIIEIRPPHGGVRSHRGDPGSQSSWSSTTGASLPSLAWRKNWNWLSWSQHDLSTPGTPGMVPSVRSTLRKITTWWEITGDSMGKSSMGACSMCNRRRCNWDQGVLGMSRRLRLNNRSLPIGCDYTKIYPPINQREKHSYNLSAFRRSALARLNTHIDRAGDYCYQFDLQIQKAHQPARLTLPQSVSKNAWVFAGTSACTSQSAARCSLWTTNALVLSSEIRRESRQRTGDLPLGLSTILEVACKTIQTQSLALKMWGPNILYGFSLSEYSTLDTSLQASTASSSYHWKFQDPYMGHI